MNEKLICIVSPNSRTYYQAVPVAKEFLDKDMNIINSTGTIPDGECTEIKISSKIVKNYKSGKLNGSLQIVDLHTGEVTLSEQYKNGVLVDVGEVTLREPLPTQLSPLLPTETLLKINKDILSFYVDGKEVAELTVTADGRTIEQLGQVPDGPVKEVDENGQIRLEATYRSNKLEGELRRYNEKGVLLSCVTYQDGQLNGPAVYYNYCTSGKITTSAYYKSAQLDGAWATTFPNGNVRSTATYSDGKLQGPKNIYYPNGQINVKENYQDGKHEGQRLVYFPEGTLWYQENYKNGHLDGERFCFFPNGKKFMEEFYIDGLLEGARTTFTEDGQMLSQEHFHRGTLVHNTERKPFK